MLCFGRIAQLAEHPAYVGEVHGSNPCTSVRDIPVLPTNSLTKPNPMPKLMSYGGGLSCDYTSPR